VCWELFVRTAWIEWIEAHYRLVPFIEFYRLCIILRNFGHLTCPCPCNIAKYLLYGSPSADCGCNQMRRLKSQIDTILRQAYCVVWSEFCSAHWMTVHIPHSTDANLTYVYVQIENSTVLFNFPDVNASVWTSSETLAKMNSVHMPKWSHWVISHFGNVIF